MEVLERRKENIREEMDRIRTHETIIVPKEDWEDVATDLAKKLEVGAKEGIRLQDFLILLSQNYGIEPEVVMKIPVVEKAERMESMRRYLKKGVAKVEEWNKKKR